MTFAKLLGLMLILSSILGCLRDETISGQTRGDTWILFDLNGDRVATYISLRFPEKGRIEGQAPCNQYFAEQNAPLPWFDVGPIGASKRACPDLGTEDAYFKALSEVTLAEVSNDLLLLSDETGVRLSYRLDE